MEQGKGKAVKIFMAIACGVGLGLVLGQELAEWWQPAVWLGPIAAGVFAWLAVDFKAALVAIPTAWRAVKPRKETLVFFGLYLLVYLLVMLWCLLPLAVCSVVISLDGALVSLASFGATMLGTVIAGLCSSSNGSDIDTLEQGSRRMKKAAWIMFPPVTVFYYLPRGLWRLVTNLVPRMVRFCGRFFAAWWRLTHSDARLLCFVYAVFFTAVGLVAGGPIVVWMIGGGALGVFDDRVATPWVQKRWPTRMAAAKE